MATRIGDPLETDIESKFCRRCADTYGYNSVKMNVEGRRNWPDRMVMLGCGRVVFIEFKRPGEEPRPAQLARHRALRRQGYAVYVCTSVAEAMKAVDLERGKA